ncbi:MAG TPA: TadE/TadG family type IV pilus assembly protein [Pseudolabrys sp.]|nr:TadE/TadG family type IV pilus assembly protein [Pseudolabrys sp.]
MRLEELFARMKNGLRALRADRRGNVAVTFALATLPVLGFVGASVDYTRASNVKAAMQAALDSTALMLAKANPGSMTQTALNSSATSYFNALFARPEAQNIAVTASYTSTGGSQVTVNGSASMSTNFMAIMGYKTLTITGSSTVTYGNSRLRVALVLDNTGSMADYGKITALKTATTNLLTQLKNAATNNGDVYVSIVPFVNAVNLDPSNYTASWVDWTDWDNANGSCSSWRYSTKSSCQAANKTWTAASHSTWSGCVTDRGAPLSTGATAPSSGNYDQTVSAPVTGNAATLYPAFQALSCPQAAMGLSYDWTSMNNLVSNMVAGGSTNQPIGLVWGWQTLVGGGPFTAPAMDSNYTYQQVIILLTDGLNTQDRWYGDGYSTNTSVDARMYDSSGNGTCANIKAAGITIYTIQVNTDGDPTSTLLQNCASSSDKFFLLTSSNQIVTTFNTIGTNLSKLRVAK